MTHFNHEWNNQTPAIPEAIGDRYYSQDLNDDFNYLKHLPYEVFLQKRNKDVVVPPSWSWNNNTNTLTLSGGFGVVLQNNVCLDPDINFTVPPTTKASPRYERIPFANASLVLPDNYSTYYIVATPTKRSLLQRTKTVLTGQYASRIRYDGVISMQYSAPTTGQIVIGLCSHKEFLLLDGNIDQGKESIFIKKWYGYGRIHSNFALALQNYYTTSSLVGQNLPIRCQDVEIESADTHIDMPYFTNSHIKINATNTSSTAINDGTFYDCTIEIGTVSTLGIGGGHFENCKISIDKTSNITGKGIDGGTFINCSIFIDKISANGILSGVFRKCIIDINSANTTANSYTIGSLAVFDQCTINIGLANSMKNLGGGNYFNCLIVINAVQKTGITNGKYHNCTIMFGSLYDNACGIDGGLLIGSPTFDCCNIEFSDIGNAVVSIKNDSYVSLSLTKIVNSNMVDTDISNTSGKLNVLNNVVVHAS